MTETPEKPANNPFTAWPKDTIFTFFNDVFNISLVERLLAAGEIHTEQIERPVVEISQAGRLQSYQFEQNTDGMWTMTQTEEGGAVGVKMDHVLSLSHARKSEPVLLVELPHQYGDEGSKTVLIDGLHRTVRHIIDGDETMTALVISRPEDLCRFHFRKDGSRTLDTLGRTTDAGKIQVRYYWAGQ